MLHLFIAQCLASIDEPGGPPEFPTAPGFLRGYGNSGFEITRQQQAIFTHYRLDCCGNITVWGVDVNPGGGNRDGDYSLDLQVWRPSPTQVVNDSTGTGCYSLVGNNQFTSISPLVFPGVAIVTPSPQDYISFQPGDVLGVYVEDAEVATDGVVVLTDSPFGRSGYVWYASITATTSQSYSGDCPYSVGNGGVLNSVVRGAPVISISISKLYGARVMIYESMHAPL